MIATALAAMFIGACLVPTGDDEKPITAVRFLTFFAALGAPFQRAWAVLLVGLAFFGLWWLLLIYVTGAMRIK